MMRLIDADAAKWEMSHGVMTQDAFGRGINFAKMCIDNMPTVDPMRYAHWVSNDPHRLRPYCSYCSEYCLNDSSGHNELSFYCPHCGAMMAERITYETD